MSAGSATLDRWLARLGLDVERAVRFGQFGAVGASGSLVNFAVFLAVVDAAHYAVAGSAAFAVAVTWNFALNWWITFDRPEGSIPRQFAQFVAVAFGGFGLYLAGLGIGVDGLGLPPALANVVGVGAGAVWNFLGAESFAFAEGGARTVPEALNALVHRVATVGRRQQFRDVGLYDPLYSSYVAVLAVLYRADERTVEAGPASATLATTSGPELVSVLHSLEKERALLEEFVDELRPGDVVWDVGANLGVYACLAGDVADAVVAVEPYPPTAERLRANVERNDVDGEVLQVALGDDTDPLDLAVERAEVGTQTPAVGGAGATTVTVDQCRGVDLVERAPHVRPPTALKVDVEGAEPQVLDGLGDLLADVRVAYVESHDNAAAIRRRLRRAGFETEALAVDGHQTTIRATRSR